MTDHKDKPVSDELLESLALCKLFLAVQDIPAEGYEGRYQADAEEMKSLSHVIGFGAFTAIEIEYKIKPIRKDQHQMIAGLVVNIRQTCVVTVEEMDNQIIDRCETQFVPQHKFAEMTGLQQDDWPNSVNLEPVEQGRLEIGRVLYQQLSGAVNPYPRKDGAEFAGGLEGAISGDYAGEGPFAALAQLQKKYQN